MRWLMMLAMTTAVSADTCLDIDTELWQVETTLQGDVSDDANGSSNNKTKHKTRKKQSFKHFDWCSPVPSPSSSYAPAS
jgi:hypothetical protein